MNSIAAVGITVIFFYSMLQVLRFYGVNESAYAIYIIFYLFLVICAVTLPREYPTITE